MSADMEKCLLKEASGIAGRTVRREEPLHGVFNVNRLLSFIQIVHRRYGVELDVNSFFIWPSIGALCDEIDQRGEIRVPKLVPLRAGDMRQPLVVFAGGVSCFLEIRSILDGLDHGGAVYGMALSDFGQPHTNPATVADEVDASCRELARHFGRTPVDLLGYSFGGVFALELARALQGFGREVPFLALIDTPQNEHAWPFSVWSGVMLRRMRRKLNALRTRDTGSTVAVPSWDDAWVGQERNKRSFVHRLRPILFRFLSPTLETYPEMAPEYLDGTPPVYERIGRQLLRMKGLYRPRRYEGDLVFYRAVGGSPIDCDPRRIWQRHLPGAEWIDVRGNHLSAIVGRNGIALGRDIGRRIRERSPFPFALKVV